MRSLAGYRYNSLTFPIVHQMLVPLVPHFLPMCLERMIESITCWSLCLSPKRNAVTELEWRYVNRLGPNNIPSLILVAKEHENLHPHLFIQQLCEISHLFT